MTPEERKLIQELEAQYDAFKPKLVRLEEVLADFQASYSDYTQLTDFYGSEDWFRLRELPSTGIKSGILSEDQLYNLITDHNELLGELLKLSSQMNKTYLKKHLLVLFTALIVYLANHGNRD